MSLPKVSTLYWNAYCASASIALFLLPKETPEFIPLQLWPPDLSPVDNIIWEILQETVYKMRITDLELSTMPLTNGCRNDDMIQLGPPRSRSLFQLFVQITAGPYSGFFNRGADWRGVPPFSLPFPPFPSPSLLLPFPLPFPSPPSLPPFP